MKNVKGKIVTKTLYIVLNIVVIISQLGIVPVFAEIINDSIEDIKMSVLNKEILVNEEIQVMFEGKSEQLDDLNLVLDPSLTQVEEERVDSTHKNITLLATQKGSFTLYGEGNGVSSNQVTINVTNEMNSLEITNNIGDELTEGFINKLDDSGGSTKNSSSEYTVDLVSPDSVDFSTSAGYIGFSYSVTINSNANTANPMTGVVIVFTPPAGYVVDSIPTGDGSPVNSYTVNDDGTVTIIFNELTNGIEEFSISVIPVIDGNASQNVNNRYDGEILEALIVGNVTPSGNEPTSQEKTTLNGSTDYAVSKEAKTSPGSTNRIVTYTFNVNRVGAINQITLQDMTLVDEIPAGAIIISSNNAGGSWMITGNQDTGSVATWTRAKQFTGVGNSLSSQDGSSPNLIVEYPEDKFPNGTKPPENIITISGHDNNPNENNGEGIIWNGTPGQAQGPELETGEGDASGISKTIANKNWLSGSVYSNYEVAGSFIAGAGSSTKVKGMILEDDSEKNDNQLFWSHFWLSNIHINLNDSIVATNAKVTLEYKTTKNDWQSAIVETAKAKTVIGFHVSGSLNYDKQDNLDKDIKLAENEILTGWRVKIEDEADKNLGENALVQISVSGVPSYANIFDKSISNELSEVKNTASQTIIYADGTVGEEKKAGALATIKPNLNLNTTIKAPGSLETGKQANYVLSMSNVTPEQDIDGVIVRVVLPAGATLDTTKGITSVSDQLGEPYNFTTPKPGEDIDITTEMLAATSDYSASRQIVTFKLKNTLPSMRSAESASDRKIEDGGFLYNIPVNISQIAFEAYQSNSQKAPVESWITTNSSDFSGYTISAFGSRNHVDTHDFDKERESIVWDNKNSQVISQGGVILSKSVEGEAGTGYSDQADVLFGENATWKLTLMNTLVTTAKTPILFDDFSKMYPEGNFVAKLSGPVVASENSKVEYSKDATAITNGDWSAEWQEAKAIRITLPDIKQAGKEEVLIPVIVPSDRNKGDVAINVVTGLTNMNGNDLSVTSNSAKINVLVPYGAVMLTKTDHLTGEFLQGAIFELQDKEGQVLQSGLTTDETGKLAITELTPGSYQLVETKAPTGYDLDGTPVPFDIVKGQTEAIEVTMSNQQTKGAVILTKTDHLTGEILQGAVFELQDKEGQVLQSGLTTDETGKLAITELTPGSYQLVETKAPTGYDLDGTPVPFDIVKGQTEAIEVTMSNQQTKGAVILTKTDHLTGEILQGAVFELQDKEGQVLQSGLTTDETGKLAITELTPGSYQLVETKAPTGYDLDGTPVPFDIVKGQTEAIEVTMSNQQTKGAVILTKTDHLTGEILQGAVFELQDKEGQVLQSGLTTDETGKLAITELTPGSYQLVETKAPTGYDLDGTPVPFDIVKGQTEAIEVTMSNQQTKGAVILTKTDHLTGEILQGAVFELQDKEGQVLQSGLTTDETGKLAITELTPGSYQLVETKAPTGYDLDGTPVPFDIVKGQTEAIEVTMSNQQTKGAVILTKTDHLTGEILQGAVFELQDKEGQVLQSGLTTDETGKLAITELTPGSYQLVETKAPTGYDLDGTPVPFDIVKGQTEAIEVTMSNQQTKGAVILTKTDHLTGEILQGAVFELQDKEGQVLQSGLTTDETGKLAITELTPGSYQLVETKAPTGYDLDGTPVPFDIVKGQTEAIEVTMSNQQTKGAVILTKTDHLTGEILQGAVFELQDKEGQVLQSGLTTDETGKLAITELTPGSYQLVETKAPTGYDLDGTPVPFDIVKGQTEAIEVTMSNQQTKGAVILEKIDDKTGELLQGAVFELQDKQGNVLKSKLVTDNTGKLVIDDLEPGSYQLVETKAPTGYDLDDTPQKFKISNGQGETTQVTVKNKLQQGIVILTKIDKETGQVLSDAIFKLTNSEGKTIIDNLTTDESGKLAITELTPGNYQLVETKAPTGYQIEESPLLFEIKKEDMKNIYLIKTNSKSDSSQLPKTGEIISDILKNTGIGLLIISYIVKKRTKSHQKLS